MNDTDLRRAYAALLDARRATDAPPAVSPERLLALVEGDGPESERIATLDAALRDPRTRRELALLQAVAANRPAPAVRRPSAWRATPVRMLAAAVVLVAVAVPAARRATRAPEPLRAAAQGPALVAPAETPTAAESRTFRWRALPGARAYSLEVLTAGGTPVFTTRTTDTTATLPADVRLTAGVEHRWWVAGELADGTQRRSPFRRLRVRAP